MAAMRNASVSASGTLTAASSAAGCRAVVVLGVAQLRFGAVLALDRALRRDRDHAAGRVLAEQRALRAAKDLDLLRVEQRQELRAHVAQREPVHQEADRRVLGHEDDVGAGAAHAAARGVEAGGVRQHEAGRQVLQRANVVDVRGCDGFGADRRDRDRHVLRRLDAHGAGDDDLLEPSGGLAFGGRRRRRGRCRRRRGRGLIVGGMCRRGGQRERDRGGDHDDSPDCFDDFPCS